MSGWLGPLRALPVRLSTVPLGFPTLRACSLNRIDAIRTLPKSRLSCED